MDELEAWRKKRLEELRQAQEVQAQEQLQQEAELEQQLQQLEDVVRQRFTKEALQRYGNLKVAHPQTAVSLLIVLGQLIQQGRVGMIDDETLKSILKQITPKKQEFRIRRK